MDIYTNESTKKRITQEYKDKERRDLETAKRQEEFDADSSGFVENTAAAFEEQFTIHSKSGQESVYDKIIQEQDAILKANNIDVSELVLQKIRQSANPTEGWSDWMRANPEVYNKIVSDNPDLGLKSAEQIEEQALDEFNKTIAEHEDVSSRSTFMGTVGKLVGVAGGYLRDPAGLASVVAPGGVVTKGMSILKSFANVAKAEIAAVTGEQLINKPSEVDLRRRLGEDVSTGQAITESAALVGGAGIIGGAIGAGIIRPIVNKFGQPVSKEALSIVEDVEHLRNTKPPGMSQKQHEAALDKALDDNFKNKDVDVSEITGKLEEPPTSRIDAVAEEFTDEVRETSFQSTKQKLEVEDVTYEVKDADGQVLETISFRQLAQKAEADDISFKTLAQCLAKGGISDGVK